MPKRNVFSKDEVALCTFVARFGPDALGGWNAIYLGHRSDGSYRMKVQNIIALLREEGIPFWRDYAPLSGLPGQDSGARRTHRDWILEWSALDKTGFLELCRRIIERSRGQN